MSLTSVGKRLVNWLFKRIIFILDNEIDHIFKKKVLKDKKLGGISGWVFSRRFGDGVNEEIIFLSSAKAQHANKDELAKTLVHEVLHILLPNVREKNILQLEDIVWDLLDQEQKRAIKSYIPKHIVKYKLPKK